MKTSPRTSSSAGAVALQAQRHRANRAYVGGHVLAVVPSPRVAARVSTPPLVAQRDRQAVELGFGAILDRRDPLPDARAPVGRSPRPPSSANALSSDSIGTPCRTSANAALGAPLTRCVGESAVISSGCCGFERAQLVHQPVVFRIRHFRIVEHVVAIIVARELRAQLQRPRRRARSICRPRGRWRAFDGTQAALAPCARFAGTRTVRCSRPARARPTRGRDFDGHLAEALQRRLGAHRAREARRRR